MRVEGGYVVCVCVALRLRRMRLRGLAVEGMRAEGGVGLSYSKGAARVGMLRKSR